MASCRDGGGAVRHYCDYVCIFNVLCYYLEHVDHLQSEKEKAVADAWIPRSPKKPDREARAFPSKGEKSAQIDDRLTLEGIPMPPKISRLPQGEFLSRGFRVVRTPYFSLKTKKNAALKSRMGAIVGKAVHKSAVTRNFFKRQAREVLAKTLLPGNDFLIIFSPAVNTLTRIQLREELARAAAHIQQ